MAYISAHAYSHACTQHTQATQVHRCAFTQARSSAPITRAGHGARSTQQPPPLHIPPSAAAFSRACAACGPCAHAVHAAPAARRGAPRPSPLRRDICRRRRRLHVCSPAGATAASGCAKGAPGADSSLFCSSPRGALNRTHGASVPAQARALMLLCVWVLAIACAGRCACGLPRAFGLVNRGGDGLFRLWGCVNGPRSAVPVG